MKERVGVIVAAGAGRRLGELGRHYSKPMVPVAGKALIVWVMERLRAAGIGRLVVVGHSSDASLAELVATQPDCDLIVQTQRKGIADAVRLALPSLSAVSGFLACACDSIFPAADLQRLVALGEEEGAGAIVGVLAMGVDATRSRSAVYAEGEKVVRIEEKPARATSGWVAMPLYWLPADIGPSLEKAIPEDGEGYVSEALTHYIEAGGMVLRCPVTERLEITCADDVEKAAASLGPLS